MPFKLNKASEQALLTYTSGYFITFNPLVGEARYLKGSQRGEVTKRLKKNLKVLSRPLLLSSQEGNGRAVFRFVFQYSKSIIT